MMTRNEFCSFAKINSIKSLPFGIPTKPVLQPTHLKSLPTTFKELLNHFADRFRINRPHSNSWNTCSLSASRCMKKICNVIPESGYNYSAGS